MAIASLFALTDADPAAASTDWVDMGPIAGTAQGRVWSRVVDEAGNTQGRAESWSLSQGVPSRIVITLRAPRPDALDLRIRLRHPNGDSGEFRLPAADKAIPGGYQQVIRRAVPGSRPVGDAMAVTGITVYPAKEGSDQRYQLTVEIAALTSQPQASASPPVAPRDAIAAQMQGVWRRYDHGTLLETLEVGRDAQGWRVRQSEPGGKANIFRILSLSEGWLELARPFAPQYGSRIRLDGNGKLVWQTYNKPDRSNWWTGSYDRSP